MRCEAQLPGLCRGEADVWVVVDGNMETEMCEPCVAALNASGEVDVEVLEG